VATYNRCWELLEQTRRTSDDDVELLTSAFVSRYHWTFVGGRVRTICADWMISRATAALGEGGLAGSYALRANIAAQADTDDWLIASTAEGLARAYAAAGEQERRDEWYLTSQRLVLAIAEDDDRELIAAQLASGPPCAQST